MSVVSIDRRHLPTDLAEWIYEHKTEIKSLIVLADMSDGTTRQLFSKTVNIDVAWAAISLIASVVASMNVEQ